MTTTNPDSEDQAAIFKEFLLKAMHSAVLRADLDRNELETIATSLRNDWISCDLALEWLWDLGLFDLAQPNEAQP